MFAKIVRIVGWFLIVFFSRAGHVGLKIWLTGLVAGQTDFFHNPPIS